MSSWESLPFLTRDIKCLKFSDDARDYGLSGNRALKALLHTLAHYPSTWGLFLPHKCNHSHPQQNIYIAEAHIGCILQHLLGLLTGPRKETFLHWQCHSDLAYFEIGHIWLHRPGLNTFYSIHLMSYALHCLCVFTIYVRYTTWFEQ